MERVRNSVKVGEKRIKEPSSYATSNGHRNNTTIKSNDHSQASHSLHHSFSNLSINNSSKGVSLWTGGAKEGDKGPTSVTSPGGGGRERADSNASRESQTSALDRFLTRHYEPRAIRLTAKVHEARGQMEFVITLMVRDFGSKDWGVIRSVDDVMRFCEAVRLAGAGVKFPMPPPAEEMMSRIEKVPNRNGEINPNVLGPMESHESTSTHGSGRRSSRHQKKRVNSILGGRESGGLGLFKAVSSRLSFSSSSKGGSTPGQTSVPKRGNTAGTNSNERTYPTVQEWFDAALEVWQRKWHSKSDEDGISLAFERFLCDPTGMTSAPIDLLTAIDFVVLVTASVPYATPMMALNRKREAVIAKAAIRLAKDYPDAITIDMLKGRVLAYAWERFETSHPMNVKELTSGQRFVVLSHEELPFMQLQIQQTPSTHPQEKRVLYSWQAHPQLATLRMNLVENFSVPPTPKSLDHFYEVWRSFSDIVLLRVEARLRSAGLGVPYSMAAASSSSMPSLDQSNKVGSGSQVNVTYDKGTEVNGGA